MNIEQFQLFIVNSVNNIWKICIQYTVLYNILKLPQWQNSSKKMPENCNCPKNSVFMEYIVTSGIVTIFELFERLLFNNKKRHVKKKIFYTCKPNLMSHSSTSFQGLHTHLHIHIYSTSCRLSSFDAYTRLVKSTVCILVGWLPVIVGLCKISLTTKRLKQNYISLVLFWLFASSNIYAF
jgi:hypothetical protein